LTVAGTVSVSARGLKSANSPSVCVNEDSAPVRRAFSGKEAGGKLNCPPHPYLDRENSDAGPKFVKRKHPVVRVHPATGWKALWVNRAMIDRVVDLDKEENDLVLNHLYDVFEKNVDIQVRFKWTPRTSALWDSR